MSSRRILVLLVLSLLCLGVGVLALRARDVGALGIIEEEGPSATAMALLAVFDGDEAQVGDALVGLLAELAGGDTPLLDRRPRYDWVDAYRLEPLRGADLSVLDGTEGAAAAVLGLDPRDEDGLDEALGRAGGVFSAVTVGCSFGALTAEAAEVDGRHVEEAEFADTPLQREVLRRSRVLSVDLGGATSEVMLRLTAQLAPARGGDITIAQRWELEVLVGRGARSTTRLLATWAEVASPEFASENRLWSGWLLHEAWADAKAWTDACQGATEETDERPGVETTGGGDGDEGAGSAADGDEGAEGAAATSEAGGGDVGIDPLPMGATERPRSVRPAPLCADVRLVTLEAHALKMQETSLELETISANIDALSEDIDAQNPDLHAGARDSELGKRLRRRGVDGPLAKWRAQGVRRWAKVVGVPRGGLSERDRAMLGRLVDRFGDAPDGYDRVVRMRLRERWRSGALAEFLGTDDVQIPVCPEDLAFAGDKLGWRTEQARLAHRDDLDLVVASLLLESGSVRAANERQWAALREIFGFGQAMMDLFMSPAPGIDRVDSNL